MAKRARAPKREGTPHDFTVIARRVVEQAIGEHLDGTPLARDPRPCNVIAANTARAAKGGKARAKKLSPAKRKAIAKKAAATRWKNQ